LSIYWRAGAVRRSALGRLEKASVRAYVDRGLVAEGLNLLVGSPKLGRSWLCLVLAVAVASGGVALGRCGATSTYLEVCADVLGSSELSASLRSCDERA
jgi:hypothetical protein